MPSRLEAPSGLGNVVTSAVGPPRHLARPTAPGVTLTIERGTQSYANRCGPSRTGSDASGLCVDAIGHVPSQRKRCSLGPRDSSPDGYDELAASGDARSLVNHEDLHPVHACVHGRLVPRPVTLEQVPA